jgi:hypothetical protein
MIQNPLAASMMQKPMQSAARSMSPQMAPPAPAPMNPTGSMGLQQSMPSPPNNALMQAIGGGLNAFRKSFDPEGYKASQDEAKAAEGDKLKQTLALMQQQRALPETQRGQWWQQNAPTISKIIGQDVSQMPLDVSKFSDQALDGQIAALSAQAGIGPEVAEPVKFQSVNLGDGGVGSFNPTTGKMDLVREPSPQTNQGPEIQKVGNQIVERQADGSWKTVFEGATEAETTRAFQGFIDQATGEQMLVMSDGTVRGTGRNAYVPPQISSVGGVPVAVDKRTLTTSELAPIADVAGNRAAVASAEVQGKAQGQAAFDLPTVEQRASLAINSIADLKSRNIGQRFGMQGKLYAIPGTDGADVQGLVNQVVSQAFLNAFDQLRGGGAITEMEGRAATAAVTRLQNQDITVGEALKAMDELQRYYQKGIQIARQKSVKSPVLPGRPAGATGSTRTRVGVPPLLAKPTPAAAGIPDGVDPADWEFMTPEQKALFQ